MVKWNSSVKRVPVLIQHLFQFSDTSYSIHTPPTTQYGMPEKVMFSIHQFNQNCNYRWIKLLSHTMKVWAYVGESGGVESEESCVYF